MAIKTAENGDVMSKYGSVANTMSLPRSSAQSLVL
jgi:hypothetical protein